jgi:exonuclease SbcC
VKPLKLTMQAFGPFAGTEHLCFDDLGHNPLFLINGPTGSGKTTLLDAMCLALYNTTTGNERQGSEMHCNQAEPDVETFVEFDFQLRDDCYRIRRLPEQMRPARRGDKLVRQAATATLYRLGPDGTEAGAELLVAKKVSAANDLVARLTGLSGEQFRQVMVLPQGEFRRLLLADSRDREAIFASLFHTGIFRKLEDALKNRAAGVRQRAEAQRNRLQGILSTSGVESLTELEQLIGQTTGSLTTATAAKEGASQAWSAADKALAAAIALEDAFTRLAASRDKAAELAAQAKDFAGRRRQLELANEAERLAPPLVLRTAADSRVEEASRIEEEAKRTLAGAGSALASAVARFEESQKRKPELDAARSRQLELEGFLGKSETLANAIAAHNTVVQAQRRAHTLLADARKQDGARRSDVLNLEAQLLELTERATPLADVGVELATLRPQVEARKQMENAALELARLVPELEKADAARAAAELASAGANTRRDELQLAWHRGQAALLAAELEDGQPCAVCGSTEHPAPAEAEQELTTQAQLERADRALQQAVSAAQAASLHCHSLSGDRQRLERVLAEYRHSLAPLAESLLSDLEEQLAAKEAGIILLQQIQKDTSVLGVKLREARASALGAADAVKTAEAAVQEEDVAVAVAKAGVTAAESDLPREFRAADALAAALTRVRVERAALERELEDAQVAHGEASQARALAEAAAQRAAIDLEKYRAEALQTAADFERALASSLFTTERECSLAAMAEPDRHRLGQLIKDYELACSNNEATLKAQQQQVEGQPRQDLEALRQALDQALDERDTASAAWNGLSQHLHSLQQVKSNFATASTDMQSLEAEYAVIGTLADVANGQTGNKISLQRFVLGALLDDVLVQASQRLLSMSAGRYQLLRKGERSRGKKASGLDLMVYDDHSGSERSVATLSGGESFMAALSLALGLSDVVQGYAGGIRLDTLFVDEGFGSLDQESLELAVRTLIDLQQSGRMVGVISHVTELRDQMEVRIDIEKGASGSRLRVVAP